MMIGVKKIGKPMDIKERSYLFEIARGMMTSIRHFIRNVLNQGAMPTLQYPEEKRVLPERFRGRHRLMQREDGTPRCVACFCCQTACPADCISIEATERDDEGEKVAARFDINILRCVFCGLCVEACPCDAIRMDTGMYELADTNRENLIYDLNTLLRH